MKLSLSRSLSSISRPVELLLPRLATMAALLGLSALAACSSIGEMVEGNRVDYKSSTKAPSLDVPPDLTQLNRDTRYVVPGSAVAASSYQIGQPTPAATTAATTVGDVKVERIGNQRWLVVNRPADKVWGPVRDFWIESGFLLTQDQQNIGIMETDWAENRAKIPQDFIRNSIGKLLDSVYSTGERDKFRTRLESNPAGGTEIYLSHRGMIETITGARGANAQMTGDSTVWQPRKADPELEAEFLQRLMVKLGTPVERAKVQVAAADPVRQTSRVTTVNNQPVVQIDEDFDRAWRRVGLSLDRTGFTVEDRNRAQGTFFVRYVDPGADRSEPGIFTRLFSSTPAIAPVKYRIAVRSEGNSTQVSVLDAQGAAETSANAQRIVQIIADDLK